MLQALFEHDIKPDLVLGTSVGALNGLVVASDPTPGAVDRLLDLWRSVAESNEVYSDRTWRQVHARRAHRDPPALGRSRCASDSSRSSATSPSRSSPCRSSAARPASSAPPSTGSREGPVVPAVVASAAVPGLLPPARVGGEHYLDGGIVNSIPVGRAVELGADRIFVLQVGRVDRPLSAPRKPWEVARVSFEIARRHRFVREMAELPDGVEAHVLPAAGSARDDSPTRLPRHLAGGRTHRGGVRRQPGLPRGAPLMPPRGHSGPAAGRGRPAADRADRADVDDAAAVAARRGHPLAVRARLAATGAPALAGRGAPDPRERRPGRAVRALDRLRVRAGGSARRSSSGSTTTSRRPTSWCSSARRGGCCGSRSRPSGRPRTPTRASRCWCSAGTRARATRSR